MMKVPAADLLRKISVLFAGKKNPLPEIADRLEYLEREHLRRLEMGFKQICTCDHCGRDITSSKDGMPGYLIALASKSMPVEGDGIKSVIVKNPLPDTHYFCNMACLGAWMGKTPKMTAIFPAEKTDGSAVVLEDGTISYPDEAHAS
jgi:hypothetical protein